MNLKYTSKKQNLSHIFRFDLIPLIVKLFADIATFAKDISQQPAETLL